MKEKASITLSREVLAGIDRLEGTRYSRSAIIERAVRNYLKESERAFISHDLEILNRAADRLKAEAEETPQYQADPWRSEMK